MKFPLKSLAFFLCLVIHLVSCSSDDDSRPANKCVPQTLWAYGDSIVYDYTASGKLSRILYYGSKTLIKVEKLEYDNKQRLSKFIRKYEAQTMPFQTFEIIYGTADKPERIDSWGANTSTPAIVTNIVHDAKGRLSTKSGPCNYLYRYEYDDNDNVKKIFCNDFLTGTEELARENHTFDTHQRFYANSPDLKIVNEYIFNHEPSQNNTLTATVYYPYANTKFITPVNVTFTLSYDGKNMITGKNNLLVSDVGEFNYNFCKYKCE